ncbi:MAG TPA: thiamine phosphate synthase [Candidatus Eisenbacteria bacterium]|nr:thiamine phosphate synthase [Candidatus Eisenbacteria bacterium]
MANRLAPPPLYVILDAALLPSDPVEFVKRLMGAGARLFQYRNKMAPAREVLQAVQALNVTARQVGAAFLVNDRPDIARLAGANGVHVGQEDLEAAAARAIVGAGAIVGVSTHNLEQIKAAADSDADYIAVGPVFATRSKAKADPVVGLELIRQARQLTRKPIVAIGGITLERAGEVITAGADSVAVISDILAAKNPMARVKQYLEMLPAAAQPAQD